MKSGKVFRFFLIWAIIITFVVSILLSVKAFTGQIIGEEVDEGVTLVSLVLFFAGILGTYVFLKRFRY